MYICLSVNAVSPFTTNIALLSALLMSDAALNMYTEAANSCRNYNFTKAY